MDNRLRGIPTAEQEALQPPAIDPVQTAVNLPMFGMMPTLMAALQGQLISMMGGWALHGPMKQMPMFYGAANQISSTMENEVRRRIIDHSLDFPPILESKCGFLIK